MVDQSKTNKQTVVKELSHIQLWGNTFTLRDTFVFWLGLIKYPPSMSVAVLHSMLQNSHEDVSWFVFEKQHWFSDIDNE